MIGYASRNAAVATYNACYGCLAASIKLTVRPLSKSFLAVDSGSSSPVCWAAIAAAALSLIMLILGKVRGLSSVSPWAFSAMSASTFGISAIAWITLTQLQLPLPIIILLAFCMLKRPKLSAWAKS